MLLRNGIIITTNMYNRTKMSEETRGGKSKMAKCEKKTRWNTYNKNEWKFE